MREQTKSAAQEAREAEADAFRRELVAACSWSLREDNRARAALSTVAEGEGVADLIQDLADLAALVESKQDAFADDKTFDADLAIERARKLASALAAGAASERLPSLEKDMRDRAFTHLDRIVSHVRTAGRYAFRNDETTRAKFTSAYARRRRRMRDRLEDRVDDSEGAPAPVVTPPVAVTT